MVSDGTSALPLCAHCHLALEPKGGDRRGLTTPVSKQTGYVNPKFGLETSVRQSTRSEVTKMLAFSAGSQMPNA